MAERSWDMESRLIEEYGIDGTYPEEPRRIFLWCVPRSLSSAVTKFMSFVDGMQVWFEPYSVCYENATARDLQYLGDDSKMKSYRQRLEEVYQDRDMTNLIEKSATTFDADLYNYDWVKTQLALPEQPETKYVFVKDMAYAVDGMTTESYLPAAPCQHTFSIRHPLAVFSSFKRAILKEFGETRSSAIDITTDCPIYRPLEFFQQLHRMWEDAKQQSGPDPVILDADELLRDPEKVLAGYFQSTGLPWSSDLLNWEPSMDICSKWNVSHSYFEKAYCNIWFKTSFNCSKFNRKVPKPGSTLAGPMLGAKMESNMDIDDDIRKCVEVSMPYYNAMKESL